MTHWKERALRAEAALKKIRDSWIDIDHAKTLHFVRSHWHWTETPDGLTVTQGG